MLIDVPTLKGFLSVPLTDTNNDALYTLIVGGVDSAIKNYCKLAIEYQTQTDYLSGTNTTDLALRQRPVFCQLTSGVMTAGSAVVTGLSPAYGLPTSMGVGQAVSDITGLTTLNVPLGTTIASIQSATQITLNQNAVASGTFNLAIGPAVNYNSGGFGGQAPAAFPLSTSLTLGKDYYADLEGSTIPNFSTSGLLKRIGGLSSGQQGFWPWYPGYGNIRDGGLTARAMPGWLNWLGNVKATYVSGWGQGPATQIPSTLPADLQLAAGMFGALMVRSIQGGAMQLQQTQGKEITQFEGALATVTSPQLGSIRQLLSRYRES